MAAGSPEECEELYARYLNLKQIEALLALYEPEGSHIRTDGTAAHGRLALRQVFSALAAGEAEFHLRLKKILRSGDDLAVLYDHWTVFTKRPDGTPMQTSGKGVHVVRRQETGAWLFAVTGVTNSVW